MNLKVLILVFLLALVIVVDAYAAENTEGLLKDTEKLIDNLQKQINEQRDAGIVDTVYHKKKPVYTPNTGTDKQIIARGLSMVKYKLKDPYSARFRNIYVEKTKLRALIGEVNAKNSFGGYNGYKWFRYYVVDGYQCVDIDDE
ncbi:MAG: hypothetical protein HGB12_12690 [Bacteroidetes bacterium]|nr:hypothetical protein [Bacteroidota bacterium]